MGCQRTIAEKIVDYEADYVLAVKENQAHLLGDIKAALSILKNHKPSKTSLKPRRLKCGWSNPYLESLVFKEF
jgi:predicted transposase YbfD/YdcC